MLLVVEEELEGKKLIITKTLVVVEKKTLKYFIKYSKVMRS